jgi:hypothetical protein
MYTTLRAVKSPCYCKQHSKIVLCTLHIKNWKIILHIKNTACYFSVKELTLYIPLAVFDCLFILYSLLNIFRRRLAIYFLRCDGKYVINAVEVFKTARLFFKIVKAQTNEHAIMQQQQP